MGTYTGKMSFRFLARYLMQGYKEHQAVVGYRIYVTDSLQMAAQDRYIKQRYIDMIKPRERASFGRIIERLTERGLRIE